MNEKAYLNEFWNDSCRLNELQNAMSAGATGATSNPPLMWKAIQSEDVARWANAVRRVHTEISTATDAAWAIMSEIAVEAAKLLEPIWRETEGRKGLLSVQVDPHYHSDAEFMIQQAIKINSIAPNLSIKIPTTRAGLEAIEELAARGINTTATVSFTVPQVIAAAEAFRRGLSKFREKGDTRPVQCFAVVMAGRLDDHLRDAAKADNITIAEEIITKAGVAVVKKAYQIFQEKHYESRLLVGAMRGAYHITEFIGGDVVLTASPAFHNVFQGAAGKLVPRLHEPVAPVIIRELSSKVPDFRRAYEEDGMPSEEFQHFGSSEKTLNQFIGAFDEIVSFAKSLTDSDAWKE